MLILQEISQDETNDSETERPAFKTTIRHLLNALSNVSRADFEHFAFNLHAHSRRKYLQAQHEYQALRTLGFKPTFNTPDYAPFDAYSNSERWYAQLELSAPLELANSLDPELDYRDEVVLLYFALFVAVREQYGDEDGRVDAQNTPLVCGPIDFEEWLADDLLAAPAIAQAVEVGR